jgi:hypothetical protein
MLRWQDVLAISSAKAIHYKHVPFGFDVPICLPERELVLIILAGRERPFRHPHFLTPRERSMIRSTSMVAVALAAVCFVGNAKAEDEKWISLFDGKTMEGWEKVGSEKSVWEVKDGAICGSGPASMLVNTTGPYKNFRYRCEVKINDKGNSGLYFRTTRKPGFMDGYEAQIDSTHSDPIRTGSLYGMCHVYKRLVEPDTWFTYDLTVRDDVWRGKPVTKIKITVNGDELYEYFDFDKTFKEGHFAFQQHDPGSKVCIRKIEVMEVPGK